MLQTVVGGGGNDPSPTIGFRHRLELRNTEEHRRRTTTTTTAAAIMKRGVMTAAAAIMKRGVMTAPANETPASSVRRIDDDVDDPWLVIGAMDPIGHVAMRNATSREPPPPPPPPLPPSSSSIIESLAVRFYFQRATVALCEKSSARSWRSNAKRDRYRVSRFNNMAARLSASSRDDFKLNESSLIAYQPVLLIIRHQVCGGAASNSELAFSRIGNMATRLSASPGDDFK